MRWPVAFQYRVLYGSIPCPPFQRGHPSCPVRPTWCRAATWHMFLWSIGYWCPEMQLLRQPLL
eukprot:6810341-Pyramimonas_sp.AAC.1